MERNEIHGGQPVKGLTVDMSPFLGTWINTNEKTSWIKSFTMSQSGDGYRVSFQGAQPPHDWGEIPITCYTDNISERAFRGEIDLDGTNILMAANTNKGLWIIAAFISFDDERTNFLCREFFYQEA